MKMRKYEILKDAELEANLKSWKELERDARVHKDTRASERCQKTIKEMDRELESRQQSA